MNKRAFFANMETIQNELDTIRTTLYLNLNKLFAVRKKKVLFDEDQPMIYHDGDAIAIEGFIDEGTVFGTGQNGQKWDLDIAELGIDDVKALAERLAHEVL